MPKQKTVVLGAGSWGTALAVLLANNGCETTLWGHEQDHMQTLAKMRCNQQFLPDVAFPAALNIESDLAVALASVQDILLVVPSHAFRIVLDQILPLISENTRIAWATKGFEAGTGKLLHEVVTECTGSERPIAVISGPNFAKEVASGLPGAVTVASAFPQFADEFAERLCNDHFRAYTSDDIIGVELGGSLKNIYAIAAGISDGLHFGANARAALITRGLAEMVRLGVTMGGQRETFMGLSGVGDLVLTCTDDQSRNRRLGLALATGKPLSQAIADIGQAVEGERAAQYVAIIADKTKVNMPISSQVEQVLHQGLNPHQAVHHLLDRKQKAEIL